jgi:hypothetical protein
MTDRVSVEYAPATPEFLSIAYSLAEAMIVPTGQCQREMLLAEALGSACPVIEIDAPIADIIKAGPDKAHLPFDAASLAAAMGVHQAERPRRDASRSAMADMAARERQAFVGELVRLLREGLAEHKTGVNETFFGRWEELRLIQGEVQT